MQDLLSVFRNAILKGLLVSTADTHTQSTPPMHEEWVSMLSTTYCCKEVKRNATRYSQSLHFHSKIPFIVAFSKPPALAVTVNFVFIFIFYIWGSVYPKRIITFQLISQEKHSLPLTLGVLLLAQLVGEYQQLSWIFQLGRRFTITLDIILNEKNIHKVFDPYYVQEKIGNVFLNTAKNRTIVSPAVGFCSQMFSLQIIPIFLCLHSYTNKTHSLKSSKWPYECGFGLFFLEGSGGA